LANPFRVRTPVDVMVPGFSFLEPWVSQLNFVINPERVCWLANPFRVRTPVDVMVPGFSFLEPWAEN
jgi:hypothetical protein